MTLLCLRPDGDWSWGIGNLERDEEDIRGIFWGVRERETREWERRAEKKYQMSRGFGRVISPLPISATLYSLSWLPCVACFFLTPPSISLTPAGSPTVQLNSDPIYLDVASDPTSVPQDCPAAPLQIPITNPSGHSCF